MTSYKILRLTSTPEEEPLWEEFDSIDADNAARAERLAVNAGGNGTYVAIPARSWKPVNYAIETKERLVKTPLHKQQEQVETAEYAEA